MESTADTKPPAIVLQPNSGRLGKQDVADATAKDVARSSTRGKAVSQSISGMPGFSGTGKGRSTPRAGGSSGPQSFTRSTDQLTSLNLHSTAPSKTASSSRHETASGAKALASQARENAPLATGLATSRSGSMWKASRIPNLVGGGRLMTPRQSSQAAFGRTISNASSSHVAVSPASSTGSSAMSRRVSEVGQVGQTTPPPRPAPRTPPSLAAAAAAAASLVASRNAAASSGGAADVPGGTSDQLKKRVVDLEQELSKASTARHRLEDEKVQLEKDKADLGIELKRATTAKEQAEAAAKAAENNAEQRLEDLLHQLDNAKHSTEAASTTSEFVRKALSQQLSGSLGLYAELEQERATTSSLQESIASLEQLRVNHEALINSMGLQKQRLKDELIHEQDMNKKLAEQLQQTTQNAPSADELRKLRFEVAYLKDREDHLKQDLDERMQELTVIRERLVGLQEKFNNLRLENLRLDQKVAEKVSSESALLEREQQIKNELNRKVTEQQQLLSIVEVIRRQKEEMSGDMEQQDINLRETQEQVSAANNSLHELRVQFDQLTAELQAQLATKTSELEQQQQLSEQVQQQLKQAEDGKQQAEDGKQQAEEHCQELQRNLERLTQELRATRLECQQLNDDVQAANDSTAAVTKQVDDLQAELEVAQHAAADAQQQRQEVSAQLLSTEEYAVSLKEELERRQDESPQLLQLRAQMDEAAQQQAVISHQLAAVQNEKQQVEVHLKKLMAENVGLKQQLSNSSGDIDMLQKELTKKVQRTDALQTDLNTATTAKTAMEGRAAELSSQLEQATIQLSIISSRDGELQTLAAELAAASSAKASLESKLVPKEKQLQEARSRNIQLSEQVKQLSSHLSSAQRELQRVQEETHQQVKAKQQELISMAGEVQAAKAEAGQLRKQLTSMGVQLEAASAQIKQQQVAMAALDQAKKEAQDKQAEMTQLYAVSHAECEELLQQVAEKQSLLATAEASLQHRQQDLAAAEEAHNSTKEQLAAVNKQLSAVSLERDELLQQQSGSRALAAALSSNLHDLQLQLKTLQAQVDSKGQEAGLLKQQLAAQSSALLQIQEQHSSRGKELQVLRQQQGKMRSEKVALEIREAEQAAAVSQLSDDIHQLNQELRDARRHNTHLQKAVEEATAQAAITAAASAAADKQVTALTAEKQKLEAQLQHESELVTAANAKAAEQSEALTSLQHEFGEATAAVTAAQALVERHAGDAAVHMAKVKTAETRCLQLQDNLRKQCLLLKELEHQKAELLQQVQQLQPQHHEAETLPTPEPAIAALALVQETADRMVGNGTVVPKTIGSSFKRTTGATGCKVTRAAAAVADAHKPTRQRQQQQQYVKADGGQHKLLRHALMWSGGAGMMLAGVVVAAVRATRPN